MSSTSSCGPVSPPPSWRGPARSRLLSRSPRAPRGSRSRDRGPASTRSPGASSRAFAGAPRRSPASRSCDLPFARNSSENPVHEPARLLCRIALGECDSFVDCHFERHTSFVELVCREAKDVPLDSAEPIGRPAFGGSGDPIVEIDHPGGYGLGCLPRKLVDLAFIERRE